jgi:redox-sensitive bicupin YhaK (pirin superfamily)
MSGKEMRKICFTLMIMALGAAHFASSPVFAASPVIDNERVTVWDITLAKGESAPPTPADMDTVVMVLEGGTFKSIGADGKTKTVTRKFGDAVFVPKGRSITDTLTSAGAAHEIIVALKDHKEPPVANPTKYPLAFPRPGSVKVLENDRVIVWHYSWTKGKPTPMHFHDKDVVVAYRYDGTLRSVTPDGTATDNAYKNGDIRFNKANRTHSELLTTGQQSAVILEFK